MMRLIFAFLLLALGLVPREANATNYQFSDREAAYAACVAFSASWEAANPRPDHPMTCTSNISRTPSTGYEDYGACNTNSPFTETSTCWASLKNTYEYPKANNGCPADYVWLADSHECFSAARCLAKPSQTVGLLNVTLAGMKMCDDKCEFEARDGTDSVLTTGAGETLHTYVGGAYKPTGQPCAAGQGGAPPPKKQECVGVPGQTMCKRDDGKNCATASTGKQICWDPGETGEKGDGSLLQVRNAGNSPSAPQTPAPPGDQLQQQGSPQTTSESIGGGSPINTTITNYTTINGTTVVSSGSTTATGGSGSAGEPDDGTPGSGGSGGGSGGGEAGGVGGGVGSLYTKGTDTVDSVWTGFKARIEGAPIMAASSEFLTFSATASCPTWSVPETAFWPPMTFTWLCEGPLADNLALAGWVALALAAYAAFKIGVL